MIKNSGNVIYIDPNRIDDFNEYDSFNMGSVAKSINNEDLCIVVGLDVEIKGRSRVSSNSGNDDNIVTLQWDSSSNGNKVSFMEGTKIYTNAERTEYIKALTTDYTKTSLFDIESEGTCEMFGIKSIDITYDSFMIPNVVIQFVDVRGVSLFAQEEMRHNLQNHSVNESVEGSFFKSFFQFPYPKYVLRVKGFYGEMVSYELTCSGFKAAFDSNTGNFNVTANFLGYAASFLTDIMTNAVICAPYSEYIGKEYWDANVSNGRFVLDADGTNSSPVPMLRIGELCAKYDDLKKSISEIIKRDGLSGALNETNSDVSEEIALMSASTISEMSTNYNRLILQLESFAGKMSESSNGDACVRALNKDGSLSNSFAFFIDDSDNDIAKELGVNGSVYKAFKEFNNSLKTNKDFINFIDEESRNTIIEHDNVINVFNDYSDIVNDETWELRNGYITEDILKSAIEEKGREERIFDSNRENKRTYNYIWYRKGNAFADAFEVYVYQDFGLKNIFNKLIGESQSNQKSISDINKKIEESLITKKFEEIFKFRPSVENITRIIMAHLETFIQMVSTCTRNIVSLGAKRSFSNSGVGDYTNFPDCGSNSPNSVNGNTIIPPFPKVVNKNKNDNRTKVEDEWIGNIKGVKDDIFEEIKIVNGILNGVGEFKKEVENIQPVSKAIESESAKKYPLVNPLSYYDLFLTENECPFGDIRGINISDVNEVFARIFLRAYTLFATQTLKSGYDSISYGKADAENFIKYFGEYELSNSIGAIIQNINVDTVLNYLLNDKKIDSSKTSNVWGIGTICGTIGVDEIYLKIGNFQSFSQQIFPAVNWYFSNMLTKNDNLVSTYLPNCIVTSCIDGDKPKDDVNSLVIEYKEGDVNYFKNIIGSKETSVKIFGNELDFNGLGDIYGNSSYPNFLYDEDGKTCSAKNLTYENGRVTNSNKYSLVIPEDIIFYNFGKSNTLKAHNFIIEVLKTQGGTNVDDFFQNTSKTMFRHMPKSLLLRNIVVRDGGEGSHLSWGNVRNSIVNFYKNYYIEWCNTFYKDYIDNVYTFKVKPGMNSNKFKSDLKKAKTGNVSDVIKVLKDYLSPNDFQRFRRLYRIEMGDGECEFKTNICPEMSFIIEELMKIVSISAVSRFNSKKNSQNRLGVGKGVISGYLEGFLTILKNRVKESENINNDNTVIKNNDPFDLKIELYNWLKLVHDKWISSGYQDDFFRIETLFDGPNPTFHFIDSAYNKIGNSININLSTLVESVIKCQTVNEYSLLSMLSNIYSSNRFNFALINNFLDLSNEDSIKMMFKPIAFNEYTEPSNHPNFVVLYPYEASSKLDISGSDYPNDSFDLSGDESSLPEMFRTKTPNDLPVPAFGVNYGQQYQNYFKNIEVNMDNPIATEQSIKAKYMIAGAYRDNKGNGPSIITAGQDLYSIYSNNSYTCTVTMMGCAWVQPLMYFVLNNIPYFGGSYLIYKVTHSLEPGFMTTKFTGVRMKNTSTRSVGDISFGLSKSSIGNTHESSMSTQKDASYSYSSPSNNCKYSYYSPLQGNTYIPEENDAKAYCYAAYRILTEKYDLQPHQAKGICANIYAESSFNPYMCTFDANKSRTLYGVSCGLGSFFYHGRAKNMYQTIYGQSAGNQILNELNKKVVGIYAKYSADTENVLSKTKNAVRNSGLKCEVPFEKQMDFIASYINDEMRQQETESESAWYWMTYFEIPSNKTDRWERYGNEVEDSIRYGSKISQDNKTEASKEKTVDDIAKSLRDSFETSLRNLSRYSTSKVEMKNINGTTYEYKTDPIAANNTLFDCVLNTYSDWFDSIQWYVGNCQLSDNASSVIINVVNERENDKSITIGFDNFNVGVCRESGDINDDLRLSLIKYFKNHNVTKPNQVKSTFRSCGLDDETINEVFELNSENSSVTDCSSSIGGCNSVVSPINVSNVSDVTMDILAESINPDTADNKRKSLFYGKEPPKDRKTIENKWLSENFIVKTNGSDGSVKTHNIRLHKSLKDNFISIIRELNESGFKIDRINSYDYRTVNGKPDTLSNHSYGIAVDINPGKKYPANTPDDPLYKYNPWYREYRGIKLNDQSTWDDKGSNQTQGSNVETRIRNYGSIAVLTFAKYGWGWGGWYGDTMHFSYASGK